ncbi:helix-turn-helix domain-containing protein [Flavobacterium hydatis]|jgi:AraC-like DNA-binding protein|uniref:HTH araC/xylS-type domain-containing protein n=1 Tax=Flavobacterium hydatis TaxID=991 RepID=A0A085ZCA5_FLAHY|nr:AraC family transcriptional regulator [Flavobacterium hydatis]KFF02069.1 hypothetical protein IW20_25460 [Flavobacterium hydatis]OXA92424.1 hypothetical protein B0A62_15450 [Flavobacterium hydatis]
MRKLQNYSAKMIDRLLLFTKYKNKIIQTSIKNTLQTLNSFDEQKKQEYLLTLDQVVVAEKIFLNRNLVIRDLSKKTSIPVHQLSILINTQYNLRFQDYINIKRVSYFIDNVDNLNWKKLTIEGMAWHSGFKSRTTCFRAFLKHTGKSPSDYFKFIKDRSQE